MREGVNPLRLYSLQQRSLLKRTAYVQITLIKILFILDISFIPESQSRTKAVKVSNA